MKSIAVTSAAFNFLTVLTSALPADYYPPPPGGWESVNYPPGTGANLPHNSGSNSPSSSVNPGSPPSPSTSPGPNGGQTPQAGLFNFTSTYSIVATPDQVVNGTTPTGGLPDCAAYFDFGINSDLDLICWNIKLVGFRGEYQSTSRTATQINEATKGQSGPPRLTFPNPAGTGTERYSYGCMKGPFTTGLIKYGQDTGYGFTVKEIEDKPSAFMADVRSSLAMAGAARAQLA